MNYRIEKYMDFENPTAEFAGVRRSAQGFGISGRYGYILFHTGIYAVYDLDTRDPRPLRVGKLDSFCDGPDKRYINHANDLVITEREGRRFMYIQAGNSGERDGGGYIARCKVEELTGEGAESRTRLVQTISFDPDSDGDRRGFEPPAWGWPCWLPDTDNGLLYIFSARYRTTAEFLKYCSDNRYIVTVFRLPDPLSGDLTLSYGDIIDQKLLPFDILFTQGGTVRDGKIYFTFGCREKYPDGMRVIDPAAGRYLARVDLHRSILGSEELECAAFTPEGRLLVNTGEGHIYSLEIDENACGCPEDEAPGEEPRGGRTDVII